MTRQTPRVLVPESDVILLPYREFVIRVLGVKSVPEGILSIVTELHVIILEIICASALVLIGQKWNVSIAFFYDVNSIDTGCLSAFRTNHLENNRNNDCQRNTYFKVV